MAEYFDETAEYYSRYRVKYPEELFKFIRKLCKANPETDNMIDLGTGTGELSIPLSPNFKKVMAADVSADMLAQAINNAKSIENITWLESKAELLNIDSGSITLVTIGKAFHWMEQQLVLNNVKKWLKPGGIMALVGGISLWNGTADWQLAVKSVIQDYLGEDRKAGDKNTVFRNPQEPYQQLLEQQFGNVSTKIFKEDYTWTVDTILGYLYSTSFSKKSLYEDKVAKFEESVKNKLSEINPKLIFNESISTELVWSAKS